MSAPKNNQFAAKEEADKICFPVIVRGTEEERERWRRAARGKKFNEWAREILNAASS